MPILVGWGAPNRSSPGDRPWPDRCAGSCLDLQFLYLFLDRPVGHAHTCCAISGMAIVGLWRMSSMIFGDPFSEPPPSRRCTVAVKRQPSRSSVNSMSGQSSRARLMPEPGPRYDPRDLRDAGSVDFPAGLHRAEGAGKLPKMFDQCRARRSSVFLCLCIERRRAPRRDSCS